MRRLVAYVGGERYASSARRQVMSAISARPMLKERLAIALLAIAALLILGVAGCSRHPAPVMDITEDAIPGLIDVELRGPAALPGKVLDQDQVEDDEWGDAFATELDVELEVDPAQEAETLAQLRARPDVIWAEPV